MNIQPKSFLDIIKTLFEKNPDLKTPTELKTHQAICKSPAFDNLSNMRSEEPEWSR